MSKLKKNTLLLSIGPHQLITQYILAQQLNIPNEELIVLRTLVNIAGQKHNVKLKQTEDYIHNILNLRNIIYIKSIYKLWGENKTKKFLRLFYLKQIIRNYLLSLNINIDNVTNIIITARYDLGEVLILSALKNLQNIYLISDGNPLMYQKTFKFPFYLRLLNFVNPYKNNPNVYFYENNTPKTFKNITIKKLNKKYVKKTYDLFLRDEKLNKWLSNLITKNKSKLTVILMQPLTIPDVDLNINYFINVVKSELINNNNHILFKQHPREQQDIFQQFKNKLQEVFGNKIIFFDDNLFSRLPVELYSDNTIFDRYITMYSTAALLIDKNKVVIYASNKFPEKYYKSSILLANEYGLKLYYI